MSALAGALQILVARCSEDTKGIQRAAVAPKYATRASHASFEDEQIFHLLLLFCYYYCCFVASCYHCCCCYNFLLWRAFRHLNCRRWKCLFVPTKVSRLSWSVATAAARASAKKYIPRVKERGNINSRQINDSPGGKYRWTVSAPK